MQSHGQPRENSTEAHGSSVPRKYLRRWRRRSRAGIRSLSDWTKPGGGPSPEAVTTPGGENMFNPWAGQGRIYLSRGEWERVHGVAADRIAAWLPSLPVGVRRYAQAHAYQALHARGAGPYDDDEISAVLGARGMEPAMRG